MTVFFNILKAVVLFFIACRTVVKCAREEGVIPPLPLPIIFDSKKGHGFAFFRYAVFFNLVYLYRPGVIEKDAVRLARHEYRHTWQSRKYAAIYRWWTCKEHKSIYYALYKTRYCSIEEDARCWAQSGKGCEELLTIASPRVLDIAFERKFVFWLLQENMDEIF